MKYIVRYSEEYSCLVEASSEEGAIKNAPFRGSEAWGGPDVSELEAEEAL